MSDRTMPRYPVYVPSKGRATTCLTADFLTVDSVPFTLVVEPQEAAQYAARYGADRLLILPWSGDDSARQSFCQERRIENGGLIAARNYIKEQSIAAGHARHWQLDDNSRRMYRWYKGKRIPCRAGVALAVVEDFCDRYENIAIAGMAYEMFGPNTGYAPPPFFCNVHVYSCTLVLNSIPQRWRIAYNDDTDICLQVLAAGMCTVLVNAFLIDKTRTMTISGGNTTDLYQGDGRLRMARSLERLWPGVVTTTRKYQRPQHHIKNSWRLFDTPLKLRAGLELDSLPDNEYGMRLQQVKDIKSAELRWLLEESQHGDDRAPGE
jgi:hypothetical protein